ncbi:hypothetical protein DFH27DRAFT_528734 [Peziza echinospora]|nr:hypothetical protein DFH27DRAFT_528734 [Peziza echinospora]
MLLPLSSASWPRSSPDGVVDLRFEYALDISDHHGSATVLASSKAKPDSLNPTKIISESTFSLLSRTYSSSSTESSCECSETSSVDENFQCGSGSPRIGPTMELNAANWVRSVNPSCDSVTAATDGDESEFSLIPVTASDAKMIIPLTATGVEQPLWPQSPQPREHVLLDGGDENSVLACTGREQPLCEIGSGDRAEDVVVAQSNDHSTSGVSTSQNSEPTEEQLLVIAPTSACENLSAVSSQTTSDASISTQSESSEATTTSTDAGPLKQRRSSLSTYGGHACSTCHLYAPSASPTFYLEAWLNQQDAERSPAQAASSKKKVSWPTTTADLRNVVVVDRWIEKGVHTHPQPVSRSHYDDDSESDSDEEEYVRKPVEASEKAEIHATVRAKSETKPTEQIRDSDSDSVASVISVRGEISTRAITAAASPQNPLQQIVKSGEPVQKSSSSSSVSSSSSNASSTSTSPSSVAPSTDLAALKTINLQQNKNIQPARAPQPHAPVPKKKYNSGMKVTVIGGPHSEHESAIRIRGADPIKHRAMIENYWQF